MAAPVACSTKKVRFPTAADAARRLARIQDTPDPTRLYVPVGFIYCPPCGGYHLTSKTAKKPGGRGKSRRGNITKGRAR